MILVSYFNSLRLLCVLGDSAVDLSVTVRSPPSRRARGGGAELIFQLGHPYGKPLVLTRLDCASCRRGNFRPDELVYFIFNQCSLHNPGLLSQQVTLGVEL